MVHYPCAMSTLTINRRKPGPAPSTAPKAKARAYAVYPIEEAAISWFARERGAESESDALRKMVALAMTMALGPDWAERMEQDAA